MEGPTSSKVYRIGQEGSLGIVVQAHMCADTEVKGFTENMLFPGVQDMTPDSAAY